MPTPTQSQAVEAAIEQLRKECYEKGYADACAEPARQQEVAAAHVGEPDDLEKIIDHYVDNYEMIGEDEQGQEGCYSPNDHEKHLLKDAIMGMLADPDWDAAWGEHITALAASRVPVASGAGSNDAN